MLAIRLQCTPQRIAEPIWLVQLWCSAWNHKPVVSLDLADNYLVCQAPCLLMDTHATGHLSWFHHVCCFFFLCTTGPLPLHNHFFPFSEVLFEGNFMHCAKKGTCRNSWSPVTVASPIHNRRTLCLWWRSPACSYDHAVSCTCHLVRRESGVSPAWVIMIIMIIIYNYAIHLFLSLILPNACVTVRVFFASQRCPRCQVMGLLPATRSWAFQSVQRKNYSDYLVLYIFPGVLSQPQHGNAAVCYICRFVLANSLLATRAVLRTLRQSKTWDLHRFATFCNKIPNGLPLPTFSICLINHQIHQCVTGE